MFTDGEESATNINSMSIKIYDHFDSVSEWLCSVAKKTVSLSDLFRFSNAVDCIFLSMMNNYY
jgi:hypothetical protein